MTARFAAAPAVLRGRVLDYGVLGLRVVPAPGAGRRGMTAGSASVPTVLRGRACRYNALRRGVAPATVNGGVA
ncbi:hypothetical protein [Streptomyces sp. NPDC101455]|uniref:hypothetical protein n=1 Tax=Streptomyces sp. NPDC101455 TaxID=3366142 RepID=UPI003809A261